MKTDVILSDLITYKKKAQTFSHAMYSHCIMGLVKLSRVVGSSFIYADDEGQKFEIATVQVSMLEHFLDIRISILLFHQARNFMLIE